jgi:hypothetical protein
MGRAGEPDDYRRRIAVAAAGAALIAGVWLVLSDGPASSTSHGAGATATGPRTPNTAIGGVASDEAGRVTIAPSRVAPAQTTVPATPTRHTGATTPTTVASTTPPTMPPTPSIVSAPTSPSSTQPQIPSHPATAPRAVSSVVVQAPPGAAGVAAALIASVNRQSGGRESIPITRENVLLLNRWMANEGGLWADNPLNTSHGAGGSPHQYTAGGQDTGIPIFPNMSVGVAANAATLLANPQYAHILHVLSRGTASCITFANAVIRSPWASGHYDSAQVGSRPGEGQGPGTARTPRTSEHPPVAVADAGPPGPLMWRCGRPSGSCGHGDDLRAGIGEWAPIPVPESLHDREPGPRQERGQRIVTEKTQRAAAVAGTIPR